MSLRRVAGAALVLLVCIQVAIAGGCSCGCVPMARGRAGWRARQAAGTMGDAQCSSANVACAQST
jgi:hypothetical protein